MAGLKSDGLSLTLEDDLGLSKNDYPHYHGEYPGKAHPTALELAQAFAFDHVCREKDIKKGLTFHGTIPECRRAAKIVGFALKDGEVKREYLSIDSKMRSNDSKKGKTRTMAKRAKAISVASSAHGLVSKLREAWMSNPQMLAVGIDMPEMQGVAVMSSMSSPVNIAQILGRPLRVTQLSFEKGYHYDTIFMDEMDDADDAANAALWDSADDLRILVRAKTVTPWRRLRARKVKCTNGRVQRPKAWQR